MTRFYKVVTIIISGFLFSIMISSCCTNEVAIIGKGDFFALLSTEIHLPTDTIREEIVLSIQPEIDNVNAGMSILNNCYATSCGLVFVNDIDYETVELYFDKAIIINSDTINPGTNLYSHETTKDYMSLLDDIYIITFKDDFYKQSLGFSEDKYRVYYNAYTTDGLFLSDTLEALIEI